MILGLLLILAATGAICVGMAVSAADPPTRHVPRAPMDRSDRDELNRRIQAGDVAYWFEYYTFKGLQKKQKDFAHSAFHKRHTVMVASRQSGKTTVLVACIVFCLIYSRNEMIEAFAPTEKQAKRILFRKVKMLLLWLMENYPELAQIVDPKEIKEEGFLTMRNNNTFRVQTAAPDSNIRGFTATKLILDESQDIIDEKYYSDIRASGAARDNLTAEDLRIIEFMSTEDSEAYLAEQDQSVSIWEIGTPKGRGHFFDAVHIEQESKTIITQTWQEAPVVSRIHIAEEREVMTAREFAREYECVFDADVKYAFPREEVIAATCIDPESITGPDSSKIYVAGVDLGQREDHTVMSIFECSYGEISEVFHWRWELRLPWTEMVSDMVQFAARWKPSLTLIDCTGGWRGVYETMILPAAAQVGWFCDGWEYTLDSKALLMRNLQLRLEQKSIEIWDDDRIRREFFKVQEERIVTSGVPKYTHTKDSHDDQVQSIALSAMAATIWMPRDSPKYSEKIANQAMRSGVGKYSTSSPELPVFHAPAGGAIGGPNPLGKSRGHPFPGGSKTLSFQDPSNSPFSRRR